MPQLVREFEKVQQVLHVPKDLAISLDNKRNTVQCHIFQCDNVEVFIPCKTRMLRRTPQKGCSSCGGDQVSNTVSMDLLQASATQSLVVNKMAVADKNVKNCTHCASTVRVECNKNLEGDEIIFGMYWSPEQFLAQVSLAGHPQHLMSGISETMQVAVDANVHWPYQDIVIHRCKWFGKYLPMAAALKDEEATILSAMPRPMRAIMSTKRIPLLEKILQDASCRMHPTRTWAW